LVTVATPITIAIIFGRPTSSSDNGTNVGFAGDHHAIGIDAVNGEFGNDGIEIMRRTEHLHPSHRRPTIPLSPSSTAITGDKAGGEAIGAITKMRPPREP
jgi:hypothetical protein